MILKNFYIDAKMNKDLRYVSRILNLSEGLIIRQLLGKYLKHFYPLNLKRGSQYNEKIMAYLLRKYQYRCASCHKKNKIDQHLQNDRIIKTRHLEIHHKNKNKHNNLLSNLIVLCPSCHKKEDAKSKKIDLIS